MPPPAITFHPARARSAGPIPVAASTSAGRGPLPGPPGPLRLPHVGGTPGTTQSPERVEAEGRSVVDENMYLTRPEPYAGRYPPTVSSSGWFCTWMWAVRGLLPGASMDHRASQGAQNPTRGQQPITVEAYVGKDYPDTARFKAIPRRWGIRAPSPGDRIRQENCSTAWRTRWVHAPHRSLAVTGLDLFYVR